MKIEKIIISITKKKNVIDDFYHVLNTTVLVNVYNSGRKSKCESVYRIDYQSG